MIRTLDEIRDTRRKRGQESMGRLAITLLAISQMDDIWMFTCNGPAIGEECPEDGWEPGDTSGLVDTAATAVAHAKAHRACYHGVLPHPATLDHLVPAIVVHTPEWRPGQEDCQRCGHSPYDRAHHGSPSGWTS